MSNLLEKARDLEVELDLYGSDAVNLATAVLIASLFCYGIANYK